MKTFAFIIVIILMSSIIELRCQENESEINGQTETPTEATQEDEYDLATTQDYTTTTTEFEYIEQNQIIPQELDYRFSSLVGGFTIDVNFTEIVGSDQTKMSMLVISTPDSPVAVEICEGKGTVKLLALAGENCDGVASGAQLDVDQIAVLNKAGMNISFGWSRGLVVKAEDS